MHDLQPHRRQQKHIADAQNNLRSEQREHQSTAGDVHSFRQGADHQKHNGRSGHQRQRGM
jgi:hypothetical protein